MALKLVRVPIDAHANSARVPICRVVSSALVLAAGCTWIAALFVPLTRSGLGSAESSHRLADLAVSAKLGNIVPAVLGFAWYATALLGCLVLATCLLRQIWVVVLRLIAGGTATSVAVVFGLRIGGSGLAGFGPAVWLALAGLSCVLAAGAMPRSQLSDPGQRPQRLPITEPQEASIG